jgi:murein L,D-transpeptidase YafK
VPSFDAGETPRRSSSSLDVSAKVVLILGLVVAIVAAGAMWANTPPAALPDDAKADLLVVEKAQRKLLAYSHGILLRSYSVSLGREPIGAKMRQGDRRTPEGQYFVDAHNPASSFHRALHVSYPSAVDVARARSAGYDPGGEIMIHGIHNGLGWVGRAHRVVDWTVGCIAVTDPDIEELYRIVPDGTRIDLRP